MSKTFKTPKGTELPIMDIKGKDYLQAAPRIVWFREERPNWGIETEFLSLSDSHAVCRATIRDENGKIMAQATSMETKQGFDSFVEKAETCAVSRAASFCNFGTLMAQELEEQGRLDERPPSDAAKLAETPQSPKANLKAVPAEPGSYVIRMGKKFLNTRLDKCGPFSPDGTPVELISYAKWIREEAAKKNQTLDPLAAETVREIDAYVAFVKSNNAARVK